MIIVSSDAYAKAEMQANEFYESNKILTCPALQIKIKLTPEGMEHLRKKSKKHHRSLSDIYVRYKCFLNIKDVLSKMHYYQEYKAEVRKVPERKQGKTIYTNKMMEYIAFIAIVKVGVDQNRIKIVLSKVHGASCYEFVSVIPSRNSKGYSYFENQEIS